MAQYEWPQRGSKPWDHIVKAAIDAINEEGEATKAEVENRLSEPALNATIGAAVSEGVNEGRSVGTGTWAALGDSITSFNGQVNYQNPGWFWRMVTYSKGRMRPEPTGGVFATGGYKLQDILDVHVPQIEALDFPPAFVICGGGSNDIAEANGATYAADPQATKDRLDQIISRVLALGATPILVKVPPRSGSVPIAANVLAWNAYIDETARGRGYAVLDMFTPLSSNLSDGGARKPGTYLNGDEDTTHPNEYGHDLIARYNVALGLPDLSASRLDLRPSLWETSIVADGTSRFLTDADSNGISDGWGTGGTVTGVTFAREAAVPGDDATGFWQVVDIPTTVTGNGWLQSQISSGWSVGDRLRLRGRLQYTGANGIADANHGYGMGIVCVSPTSTQGFVRQIRDMPDGQFEVYGTVPTGTTAVYIRLLWAYNSPTVQKMRVANVRVENLSVTP